jgi:hypothetical protein
VTLSGRRGAAYDFGHFATDTPKVGHRRGIQSLASFRERARDSTVRRHRLGCSCVLGFTANAAVWGEAAESVSLGIRLGVAVGVALGVGVGVAVGVEVGAASGRRRILSPNAATVRSL